MWACTSVIAQALASVPSTRKEGGKEGREEGKREGRKEAKMEGGKERRREGRREEVRKEGIQYLTPSLGERRK